MILVIDDERRFSNPGPNDLTTYATSSITAMMLLEAGDNYSVICFDHDLGGEDTTREVALYLAERAFYGKPYPCTDVIVHTANVIGAEWLMSTLKDYNPQRIEATKIGLVKR